jgi:hypothetical protein
LGISGHSTSIQCEASPVTALAQLFLHPGVGHMYNFVLLILVTLQSTQVLGNTSICLNESIFIAAAKAGG